jgi:hypothetical protein
MGRDDAGPYETRELTRREALTAAAGAGALLALGRFTEGAPAHAAGFPTFGWPPDAGPAPVTAGLASTSRPKCWWMDKRWTGGVVPPVPGEHFAHASAHVHAGLAFPHGERIVPVSGRFVYDAVLRLHNFNPIAGVRGQGSMRGFRGGILTGRGGKTTFLPGGPWAPKVAHETRVTRISQPARGSGKCEARFTLDTTGPTGDRQFQSGATGHT